MHNSILYIAKVLNTLGNNGSHSSPGPRIHRAEVTIQFITRMLAPLSFVQNLHMLSTSKLKHIMYKHVDMGHLVWPIHQLSFTDK